MPGETAEITVQYLGLNKKNEKYGYIKSSEGEFYGCSSTQLGQFTTGEVCKINWRTNNKGYKEFVSKIGTTRAPPLSPPPRPRMNPVDNENIFIGMCLKEYIKVGAVNLSTTEIVEAVKTIRDAYRFTSSAKQQDDSLDDGVPY